MIVDTSALIAILTGEEGSAALLDALDAEPALLPAPARVELLRVASGSRLQLADQAQQLLAEWEDGGLTTIPFDARHAEIASQANSLYRSGNGQGGLLNLLDLMVYAVRRSAASHCCAQARILQRQTSSSMPQADPSRS